MNLNIRSRKLHEFETDKISDWAHNVQLEQMKRNDYAPQEKKRKNEVKIYLNYKSSEQDKISRDYFDSKQLFREHNNYMEDKCVKLIFVLSISAKLTCGLGHEALKSIYTCGNLSLMLYGAPDWKHMLI